MDKLDKKTLGERGDETLEVSSQLGSKHVHVSEEDVRGPGRLSHGLSDAATDANLHLLSQSESPDKAEDGYTHPVPSLRRLLPADRRQDHHWWGSCQRMDLRNGTPMLIPDVARDRSDRHLRPSPRCQPRW